MNGLQKQGFRIMKLDVGAGVMDMVMVLVYGFPMGSDNLARDVDLELGFS